MNSDQNWYRQLGALALLSASRAAVEFITNPGAPDEAGSKLRDAFRQIDYEAVAKAITRAIDDLAETSKGRLSDTIDSIRDTGVDAVGAAQEKAQSKLGGRKKKGKKMRFLLGLLVGGAIAYFIFDQERRDTLLDRMTGASGPIQPTQSFTQQASSAAHQASSTVQHAANTAAHVASETASKVADLTEDKKPDK